MLDETSVIKFSQKSVSARFRSGQSLEDAMQDIAEQGRWAYPAIRIVRAKGKPFTLDNRRLLVAKVLQETKWVHAIPVRWVKVSQREWAFKHTTMDEGESVAVEGTAWIWGKHVVTVPLQGLMSGCRIFHLPPWKRVEKEKEQGAKRSGPRGHRVECGR